MKFSVLVLGAPYSSQAVDSARLFVEAVLAQGHQVHRVFFYHDAVHSANALSTPPQDEPAIPRQWQTLAEKHQLDLVVCVSTALKRGILNSEEADRYDKPAFNLQQGFDISGLGQWVDACLESDRVVTFGD